MDAVALYGLEISAEKLEEDGLEPEAAFLRFCLARRKAGLSVSSLDYATQEATDYDQRPFEKDARLYFCRDVATGEVAKVGPFWATAGPRYGTTINGREVLFSIDGVQADRPFGNRGFRIIRAVEGT